MTDKICKVEGCDRPVLCKGVCESCYAKIKRGTIKVDGVVLGARKKKPQVVHSENDVRVLQSQLEGVRKELIEERERTGTGKLMDMAEAWEETALEWKKLYNECGASLFAEQKIHGITEQALKSCESANVEWKDTCDKLERLTSNLETENEFLICTVRTQARYLGGK